MIALRRTAAALAGTVKDGRSSAIVRQGPSVNVGGCRDRETPPYEYVCKSSHRPKLFTTSYTKAVRDVSAMAVRRNKHEQSRTRPRYGPKKYPLTRPIRVQSMSHEDADAENETRCCDYLGHPATSFHQKQHHAVPSALERGPPALPQAAQV